MRRDSMVINFISRVQGEYLLDAGALKLALNRIKYWYPRWGLYTSEVAKLVGIRRISKVLPRSRDVL